MCLLLHCANFRYSHIPCYEFRLLRDQSRPAGLARRQLVALPSLRYRIEMVGKLVINGERGGMRGAPCGLRPCRVRKPLNVNR